MKSTVFWVVKPYVLEECGSSIFRMVEKPSEKPAESDVKLSSSLLLVSCLA
jgi:hypothetical protein